MTFAEYEAARKEEEAAERSDSRSRLERAHDAMRRAAREVSRSWCLEMTEITTSGENYFCVSLHHYEYGESDELTLSKALRILEKIRDWKNGRIDCLPSDKG